MVKTQRPDAASQPCDFFLNTCLLDIHMKAHPTLSLAAMVLATSAYASSSAPPQIQRASVPVAPFDAAPATLAAALPQDESSAMRSGAYTNDIASSDPDAEEIYEQKWARDPWEGLNRKIHGFNNAADRWVLRPVAAGYDTITPASVQAGVSHFFANLRIPATALNQALQGRPKHAAQSLGRLLVNSTVGIGGLFDPASHLGIAKRNDEDFGQTLASWGWRDSRYLVLPLLGPRTVRDTVAIAGDQPMSPIGQIDDNGTYNGLLLLQTVDGRARMLPLDKFRQDALDDYLLVRDAWVQRRNHQIRQDLRPHRD